MIKLYNTLTSNKDTFTPIDPNHVKMYVCGPLSTTTSTSATPAPWSSSTYFIGS